MMKNDPASPAPERLHALDALRAIALLLGIVLHATLSFLPTQVRIWVIQDSHPSTTLGVVFFAIHVFRMTTFFLIAGFFAHLSFHRRGARDFIRDRLRRIALPFAVGWPLLGAVIGGVVLWAATFPHGGPLPGSVPGQRFSLTHLWFLYVLLEFYAAALVLRTGIAWLDSRNRFRAGIDALMALVMRSPLAPAILAVPIAIAFNLDPKWLAWYGIRTPDNSLVTNLQAVIGFGTAFGFGWLLHRQVDLLRILERRWALHLIAAVILIAASLFLAIVPSPRPEAIRFAGATCYALAIWTTSFAVIGVALRFLAGFSATWRYLADASYWLYLIHLPILMALQVAVSQLDWPWPVKFAVILTAAMVPMLASYHYLVRDTVIGMVLNGRRMPRRQRIAVTAAESAAT